VTSNRKAAGDKGPEVYQRSSQRGDVKSEYRNQLHITVGKSSKFQAPTSKEAPSFNIQKTGRTALFWELKD
jgi:hypothetical protein